MTVSLPSQSLRPVPSESPWGRRVRRCSWLLLVVAAVLLAGAIGGQVRRGRALERQGRESARKQAVDAVRTIDAELQQVVPTVDALARDVSDGRLSIAEVSKRVQADLAAHPSLFEMGIGFQPYAADPKTRLYGPHASRASGRPEPLQIEQRYDYTTYDWFKQGLANPGWGEPYFGAATGALVVGYNVPVYRSGDRTTPIGVARANFSLDAIRSMVARVSLGETGYGILFSRNGVLLSHPDDTFVRQQLNVRVLAGRLHETQRIPLYERALRGESTEDLTSTDDGRQVWLVQEPVKAAGWVFAVEFFADEVALDARDVRRGFMKIAGAALLVLFAVTLLVVRVDRGGPRELWKGTIATGVLLAAAIAAAWILTMRFPDRNGETSVHIFDWASLQKFLASHVERGPARVDPLQIPTGMLVRTIRFVDANDIVITGTVWQRVPVSRKSDVRLGVEMPDAETFSLGDATTVPAGEEELTSWTFRANLREPSIWARKYPFDYALMQLRMIAKLSTGPTVLVPDLGAYDMLRPQALPGVDPSLILSGWDVDHSYFSYVGQGSRIGPTGPRNLTAALPYDLAFNVVAERRFLDPFVSSVLPIIVIACLLFGLLIVGSKNSQRVSATGFKATDVLRASVALLFPALVAQVNLRGKIGATEVIYIEYFYFILYVAILGVSANALTFTLGASGVSQVRDNLIPKLAYWPAVLGACFLVTLVFLY